MSFFESEYFGMEVGAGSPATIVQHPLFVCARNLRANGPVTALGSRFNNHCTLTFHGFPFFHRTICDEP